MNVENLLVLVLVLFISFSNKSWLSNITLRKILSHYIFKIFILTSIVFIGGYNFLLAILLGLSYSVINDYLNAHDYETFTNMKF